VEGIDVDGVAFEIGHEGEVAPLGPQGGLATDQSGAPHDEAPSLVVHSATSASPSLVYSIGVQADSSMAEMALTTDLIMRTPMVKPTSRRSRVAMVVGPKARVKAHDELAGRPGPAHPGHQLFDEAHRPALGVGAPFAQADVEHLAGAGPRGDEGVIAEHVGVAIARPTLGLAAHLADGRVEIDDHLVAPGPAPSDQARRSASASTVSS
jgi:hypothetical protein